MSYDFNYQRSLDQYHTGALQLSDFLLQAFQNYYLDEWPIEILCIMTHEGFFFLTKNGDRVFESKFPLYDEPSNTIKSQDFSPWLMRLTIGY